MQRTTVAFVLFLVAGAAGYFGILPASERLGALRSKIQRLESSQVELEELARVEEQLLAAYRQIAAADLAKVKAMAPPTPDTAGALVDFETLARANGLPLERVDFRAGGEAAGALVPPSGVRVSGIGVTMALKGSYETLKSFLRGLERNLRLVDVSTLSFSTGEAGTFPLSLEAKMYHRR